MDFHDSYTTQPLQGSFERELQKIFFALRGADRTGEKCDYFPGINLFLSTLCFNASSDDNDMWLSVTPPLSGHVQYYKSSDFTINLAHSSSKTTGRDYTTIPILLINSMDSELDEEGESDMYNQLRSKVSIVYQEMVGQPGTPTVISTLTFIGGTWRWDDWSCKITSFRFPVRMERGRGGSVIHARTTFSSRIAAYKAWEVPTPMGLEIDPNFIDLWAGLLENFNLEPKVLTQVNSVVLKLEPLPGSQNKGRKKIRPRIRGAYSGVAMRIRSKLRLVYNRLATHPARFPGRTL